MQCSPMAVGSSDISGNDWLGPINSSPAADRMSDEIFIRHKTYDKFYLKSESINRFVANLVFFGRNLSLGPAKNDHVCPLGLAIICEK